MKKIYLLLITACTISFSCESPDSSPQVIGYTTSEDGKTDVVAGPDNIAAVWEAYIDAHNSRDTERIRALNADEFSAYGPAGEVVEGSDEHIAFLTDWFENNNPRWTIQWAISNTGENINGEISDFLTAGHELILNIEGVDTTFYQVIDVMISDGEVINFNVYQQQRGEPVVE